MHRFGPLFVIAAVAACAPASGGETQSSVPPVGDVGSEETLPPVGTTRLPEPGTAWVIFGTDTAFAEVAQTPAERERGLMDRDSLEPNHGMLFLFERSDIRSFWMKNTFIPLDGAFMDESFRIINIVHMDPETEDLHSSEAPALAALEMTQGWFASKGIEAGDVAEVVFGR